MQGCRPERESATPAGTVRPGCAFESDPPQPTPETRADRSGIAQAQGGRRGALRAVSPNPRQSVS